MSKAFDTVSRSKLLEILRHRGVEEGDVGLIKLLLTNTSLQIKRGKSIGTEFATDIGVPQGDGLSPKLFTIYLDEALKEIEQKLANLKSSLHDYAQQHPGILMHDHDYPRIGIPAIPDHLEYADDVDFLFRDDELADKAIMTIKQTLKKYNLQLNESKTEKVRYTRDCNLRKVKKLGTILDEGAEINRRKQLASLAMSKYRRIWRNKYITVRRKTKI